MILGLAAGLLRLVPIRRRDQALFAETLGQALAIGMRVMDALELAASVSPSRRFRAYLVQMASYCVQGYPLEVSLEKTGASVSPGLRAALRVGELQGCLSSELRAFARTVDAQAAKRLARSLGRAEEATAFAACLARLLDERRLSPTLIRDAGHVAARGSSSLGSVFSRVALDVEDGAPFSFALKQHPTIFDPVYCRFIDAATGRNELRDTLTILGGSGRGCL